MAYILRIARDSQIEESRKAGLLFLSTTAKHLVGQQWQVRYYKDEDRTEIDTIVAIGIKNGTGSDCYRVISYGVKSSIIAITDTLPDVSELVHGEVYIVNVINETYPDGAWCYVTATNNIRRIDPIVGGPYAYNNLEDGMIWYFSDGVMRREDDFYTREELGAVIEHLQEIDRYLQTLLARIVNSEVRLDEHDAWLRDLDCMCFPLTIKATSRPESTIWASGTSHDVEVTFSASKMQRTGETLDVTSDCSFFYRLDSAEDFIEATQNPIVLENLIGEDETIELEVMGGNKSKYGLYKYADPIDYEFGYRVLYGLTWGNIEEERLEDILQCTDPVRRDTYYKATYTTNLGNLATFAIPAAWGDVYKITDDSGTVEYTNSFEKLPHVFKVHYNGETEVDYVVYRWCSKPTVASGFTYRFYNKLGEEEPGYVPTDIEVLKETVEMLNGSEDTVGSIKYQINEAKDDLIGTIEDLATNDTINGSKNLTRDSLQFVKYD